MVSSELSFLIAMPSLKDSVFSRSLIAMVEQNSSGALGFIINLPTGTTVNQALSMLKMSIRLDKDLPILFGGPVQTDFFWVMHAKGFSCRSTLPINSQLSISSALDILPILEEDYCPEIYQVGVGYSGWDASQLTKEIEEGSWWMTGLDKDLIFSTAHQERWKVALRTLGVDPKHLFDFTDPINPSIN
ncbi:MAG: putative transcriptional regulator [bacterium]|jgi:putative transcriptional regulator